jgi:hypothetical protein
MRKIILISLMVLLISTTVAVAYPYYKEGSDYGYYGYNGFNSDKYEFKSVLKYKSSNSYVKEKVSKSYIVRKDNSDGWSSYKDDYNEWFDNKDDHGFFTSSRKYYKPYYVTGYNYAKNGNFFVKYTEVKPTNKRIVKQHSFVLNSN